MKVNFKYIDGGLSRELDCAQLIALFNANEINVLEGENKFPLGGVSSAQIIKNTIYNANSFLQYPELDVYLERAEEPQ